MTHFLNILCFVLEWAYVFIFFWILHTFLPVHRNWFLRILAFFACSFFFLFFFGSNSLPFVLASVV